MGKNPGKKFEEDFIKSVPNRCDITRLKDGGGWSDATNTRFTSSNPCDFIIFSWFTETAEPYKNMYKLELKSTALKSLPFSNIKDHQLSGLCDAAEKGVNSLFIINFRSVNETYRIGAEDLRNYIETCNRKSIPLLDVRHLGVKIPQSLIRVRYRYDLEWM